LYRMKSLGAFLLLLGLVYGFEDNELIIRSSRPGITHPHINAKSSGHLRKTLKDGIIIGKIKTDFAFDDVANNEFFPIEKVNEEKIAPNLKFLRAIKKTKDNELRNIFADDFEGDNFFLITKRTRSFVDDTLRAVKGQAVKKLLVKV